MLKLKLQYFGHLMWRADSFERPWCWEGLKAGGEGDDRGWNGWMALPTQGTWVWVDSGTWWWTGGPGVLWFMGLQGVGHDRVTELNWTEQLSRVSLVAQMVKSLPSVQETWVWSLAWEDPLEKKMANHSSVLGCKIPWTENPGRLQPMGSQRFGHDWTTSLSFSRVKLGKD